MARTPVAILDGEPPLQTVCSVTARARKIGVTAGMTKAELDVFSGLTVLPRSRAEENAARSVIVQAAAMYTPRMEVCCTPEDRFVCVLDMAGTERIFGDARKSSSAIERSVRSLGIRAKLAASGDFHTAVCVAPFARSEPLVVPAGKEQERLAPLPVAALNATPSQAATFELWGIRTVGEFAALPETDIVVRLGQEGKRLHALARGEHPHLMVPEESAFVLEDAIEFDEPEERLDAILFIVGPMLDQFIRRAQAQALSLASVTFRMALDGGGEHIRTLKPALPLSDRIVLLKLLNLDIQAHPPPTGVVGLRVVAEPGERGKVQMGLFSPQLPEATRLDVTLAQIEAMTGEGRVGSPRLLDTHHPESFAMERFVVPIKPSGVALARLTTVQRRVRPPVMLKVWQDVPGGKPSSFAYEGKRYGVTDAFGPWRRSGEWWSQRVWSCEEWDVRASAGEKVMLCVLAHDLLSREWRLEAFYD